jgi:lysozyme family protein
LRPIGDHAVKGGSASSFRVLARDQEDHAARDRDCVVGEATQGALMSKVRQALDDELANILFAGSTGSVT